MMTDNELNLEEHNPPYEVRLSEAAGIVYRELSKTKAFTKLRKMIEILDTVPEIGRLYDRNYPAARPNMDLRIAFAGRYGIYYTVEEAEKTVRVMFIEDQRRDPFNLFYGIYPHEAE